MFKKMRTAVALQNQQNKTYIFILFVASLCVLHSEARETRGPLRTYIVLFVASLFLHLEARET